MNGALPPGDWTMDDPFSGKTRHIHMPVRTDRIYTRWLRVDTFSKEDPNRWRPNFRLTINLTETGKSFRLDLQGNRFDMRIHPISRKHWVHNRPQRIFGWEFDK